MSNLLEQASLVMIPSGYAEDIVYSEIPIDGAGDLSFTRASNGTRVNFDGLVEVVPWNLVDNSENLTLWGSYAVSGTITRTANYATAPNGTITATRIQNSGGSFVQWTYQDINLINGGTISMYVKRTGSTNQTFRLFGNNGAEVSADFTATSEWQRFEFTILPSGSTKPQGITTDSSANAADILVWGGQINIGATAKPYFPTTDRLNVPRLTYQNGGGGCPSLLLEKQSTNLMLYSEQLDNAAWAKNGFAITANAAISPDGTQNADLAYQTVSGDKDLYQITSSVTPVFSIYAKAAGKNWVVTFDAAGGNSTWYNISNGTLGTVASGVTATIDSVGNGWYKLTYYHNTAGFYRFVKPVDSNNSVSAVASGTDGAYLWGAQLEVSSYPTSYIPTTSATATRVADACYKTGISSLIGQSQGTIFVDFVWEGLGTASVDNPIFSIGEQSYGTSNIAISNYNSSLYGRLTNGASVDAGVSFGAMTIGTRYKCAIGYASNDFVFYVNGLNYGNDTSVSIPALSDAYFQNAYPNSKEVNQAIIFPTRLTNAELASLTTI
jgi:hypothetical protein